MKMVYIILLLVGAGFLVFAVLKFRESLAMLRDGYAADAVVIDLKVSSDSDGDAYAPVFEFSTHDHQTIQYLEPVYSTPSSWSVGDHAKIFYDPQNTQKVMISTYWGMFRWPVILLAIAMPFLVIGGGYFITWRLLK